MVQRKTCWDVLLLGDGNLQSGLHFPLQIVSGSTSSDVAMLCRLLHLGRTCFSWQVDDSKLKDFDSQVALQVQELQAGGSSDMMHDVVSFLWKLKLSS